MIQPYKDWNCFSSKTNTSLRKKAETLIKRVQVDDPKKQLKAIQMFFNGYSKMCQKEGHIKAGCSDTMVRETVWDFGLKVGKELNLSYDQIDAVWENRT